MIFVRVSSRGRAAALPFYALFIHRRGGESPCGRARARALIDRKLFGRSSRLASPHGDTLFVFSGRSDLTILSSDARRIRAGCGHRIGCSTKRASERALTKGSKTPRSPWRGTFLPSAGEKYQFPRRQNFPALLLASNNERARRDIERT